MRRILGIALSLYFVMALFLAAGRALLLVADQADRLSGLVEFWGRLSAAGGVNIGAAVAILAGIGGLALGWDGIRKHKKDERSAILDHRGKPIDWSRRISPRSVALWASIAVPPVLLIVVLSVALFRGGSTPIYRYSGLPLTSDPILLPSQNPPPETQAAPTLAPLDSRPDIEATRESPDRAKRRKKKHAEPVDPFAAAPIGAPLEDLRRPADSDRNPNALYQFGDLVADVDGAQIDRPMGTVRFFVIKPVMNSKLDPDQNVDYQNLVLHCHDPQVGPLPSARLPSGVFAMNVIPRAVIGGYTCKIVGRR